MQFLFLLEFLLLVSTEYSIEASLLFPASSVLQITASLAAPIELPGRKLYWDWGFQMNYDLPFNVSQFYNAPIWPGTFGDRNRREIEGRQWCNETCWSGVYSKYKNENKNSEKHPNDFSAGELYESFENLLISYGFHETCLMRSVCELARHPFSDDEANILTEVLTFILTPSLHEAFSPSETLYREVYEIAERRGFLHYNCAALYLDCKQDLLTILTRVLTNSNSDRNYEN